MSEKSSTLHFRSNYNMVNIYKLKPSYLYRSKKDEKCLIILPDYLSLQS